MSNKEDALERRYYPLEELLENFEMDGHQNSPRFIVFEPLLAVPFIFSVYTFNGKVLLLVVALIVFEIWLRLRNNGTAGIRGWLVRRRRTWLTGTKKVPRHHGSR